MGSLHHLNPEHTDPLQVVARYVAEYNTTKADGAFLTALAEERCLAGLPLTLVEVWGAVDEERERRGGLASCASLGVSRSGLAKRQGWQ